MVDKDEGSNIGKDPMRLCYVCRMPISVLAIRCRYCGAEVGRPRKEQETFTVADLGGEKVGTYTVSGNVTDALESFMMEERAQLEEEERERLEAERRSIAGRLRSLVGSRPEEKTEKYNLDFRMGGLDVNAINLSASSHRSTTQRKRFPGQGLGKSIFVIAIIVISLLVMYFVADAAWKRVRGSRSGSAAEENFVYPNRALEIMAEGGGLVEAHAEAMMALKQNDTENNRAIARKVREKVIADVKARAYSNPFDMAKLNSASRDITQIGQRDSNTEITQLMATINREVGYFAFVLTQTDLDNGTAVFRLNNPALTEKEQEVSVGDMLQQRFRVIEITTVGVVLEDTAPEAGGRQLLAKKMTAVQAY